MEGYEVKKMRDAVREADIIVTATGNCDIITSEHFPLMKDKAVLCNIEHFDDEIDMAWLNNNYGDSKINIKIQVDKYNIYGKELIVLAEVRLVNMGCSIGHLYIVM